MLKPPLPTVTPHIAKDVEAKYKSLSQTLTDTIISMIDHPADPKIGLALCSRALVHVLVPLRMRVPAIYKTICEQVDLIVERIEKDKNKKQQ